MKKKEDNPFVDGETTKPGTHDFAEYELELVEETEIHNLSRTSLKLEQALDRINKGQVKAFALVVLTEKDGLESITIKYDSPLSRMALEIALDLARERVRKDVEVRVEEMSEVIE